MNPAVIIALATAALAGFLTAVFLVASAVVTAVGTVLALVFQALGLL